MGLGTKKQKKAKQNNLYNFNHYLTQLVSIGLAQFEYSKLPMSIEPLYLERILFFEGVGCFFYDDILEEYLFLSVNPKGNFDLNDEPIYREAYGNNGYHVSLDNKNSVLIYNNVLHYPTIFSANLYAEKICCVQNTLDINVNSLKNPVIMQGTKNKLETLKNMFSQYDGNEPVLYIDEQISIDDNFKVFNPNIQSHIEELQNYKTYLWSEYLNLLGIASQTFQKKERIIRDEVAYSLGGAMANYSTRLKCRKIGIEKINRMFGLDIEVDSKKYEDVMNILKETEVIK